LAITNQTSSNHATTMCECCSPPGEGSGVRGDRFSARRKPVMWSHACSAPPQPSARAANSVAPHPSPLVRAIAVQSLTLTSPKERGIEPALSPPPVIPESPQGLSGTQPRRRNKVPDICCANSGMTGAGEGACAELLRAEAFRSLHARHSRWPVAIREPISERGREIVMPRFRPRAPPRRTRLIAPFRDGPPDRYAVGGDA